jgi:hypothetical protein
VTGAALVVVAALAVPVVRSFGPADRRQQELSGIVPTGQGQQACHQLDHHGVRTTIDSQVIDGATAVGWLHNIDSPWADRLGGVDSVTVCVLAEKRPDYWVTVLRPQRRPAVVATGDYSAMASAMTGLSAVQQSATPTTLHEPFGCPNPLKRTNVPLPGSATLPMGAKSVRICTDGSWYYPPQSLTTGVDDIVRTVNARPLTYDRGSTCGGMPGAHGYFLVFRYAQGTRTVEGDFCGWMGVGPVQRKDTFPTVGNRVLADLAAQESSHGVVAPAPCPGKTGEPMGRGDLTHIVAARFCPAGSTGTGVLLTGVRLKRLTTATGRYDGSYTQIEHACPRPGGGWPHLMLSDAWHEQFSVTLKCRGLRYWDVVLAGGPGHVVRPVLIFGVSDLMRALATGL